MEFPAGCLFSVPSGGPPSASSDLHVADCEASDARLAGTLGQGRSTSPGVLDCARVRSDRTLGRFRAGSAPSVKGGVRSCALAPGWSVTLPYRKRFRIRERRLSTAPALPGSATTGAQRFRSGWAPVGASLAFRAAAHSPPSPGRAVTGVNSRPFGIPSSALLPERRSPAHPQRSRGRAAGPLRARFPDPEIAAAHKTPLHPEDKPGKTPSRHLPVVVRLAASSRRCVRTVAPGSAGNGFSVAGISGRDAP